MKQLLVWFLLLVSPIAFALKVGQEAPAFSLGGMANVKPGQKLSLKDFKGKVVYLDFWASWCGPCAKSLPALDEIRKKYAGRGFEVLAVNLDENPDDGLAFLRDHPVSYPVVYDPKGDVPSAYDVQGMPYAFIIDRQGKVHHIHAGYREGNEKKGEGDKVKIDLMVYELLGKK